VPRSHKGSVLGQLEEEYWWELARPGSLWKSGRWSRGLSSSI